MTETQMISTEEFAKRLNVSRTTVFDWMKTGKLVQGQHYLKIGRVIRFPWGEELIQKLIGSNLEIAPAIKIGTRTIAPTSPTPSTGAIDLEYR